jgi:outer membrane protein OmpA-like peptidoglycan-associated protein
MRAFYRIQFVFFTIFCLPFFVLAQNVNKDKHDIGTISIGDTIITPLDGINSKYADYAAFILPADSILLFTSRRKPAVFPGSVFNMSGENIWWTKMHNDVWDSPVKSLQSINKLGNSSMAGVSADGTEFYIYSDRNNGDILVCQIDSMISKPTPIDGNINTSYRETTIAVLQNGRTCFFCSNRTDLENFGGMDIFSAEKDSTGRWTNIQNAGKEVNTEYDENFVSYSSIDSVIWFSSNRPEGKGGYDIYGSKLAKNGRLKVPKNIGDRINTEYNDIYWNKYGNRALYSTYKGDSAQNICEVIFPDHKNPIHITKWYVDGIHFAIGSNDIKTHTGLLDSLSLLLQRLPGLKICIKGYADGLTGNTISNNLLSLARANSVAKYLVQKGVTPLQLKVEAGGENSPISIAAAPNRRVEFSIIEQDKKERVIIIHTNQKRLSQSTFVP